MFPKRLFRILFIGYGVSKLLSCAILFAPLQGRWNALDPEHDYATKTVALLPVEDGYVYEGDGLYHDDPELRISVDIILKQHASLLKFDLTQIPVEDLIFIRGAYLSLFCNAESVPNDFVVIKRIKQPWDSMVTYGTVFPAAFIDDTIDVGGTLPITAGLENTYDIFPIVEAWFSGRLNYGIRLHGDAAFGGAVTAFSSSNSGNNSPKLVVTYLARE